MGSDIPKQYLPLAGRPLLSYALDVFQKSACIQEIVIVCETGGEERLRREILQAQDGSEVCARYPKVSAVVPGGAERYISVCHGLRALSPDTEAAFIHDGARPFVTEALIEQLSALVQRHGACAVAAPATDTVRLVDEAGCAQETPDRRFVRLMQTPQVFRYPQILEAYEALLRDASAAATAITDDVQVWQQYAPAPTPVRILDGDATNLKITTPLDMRVAELLLADYSR